MSGDLRLGRSMIGAAGRGSALRAVVVGLLSSLVVASPAMAVDITVTTLNDSLTVPNDDNLCSLREAIAAVASETAMDTCSAGASGLDRILFFPSLFPAGVPQMIFLLDELQIPNRSLDIIGPGARQLTISGQNNVRVFRVLPPATSPRTVSDITIANGRIDDGGGVLNQGNLTIKNATIRDNVGTDDGGGIDNGGNLRVENSTFTGNSTNEEGGGVINFQNATFVNTTFSGNRAGLNATSPTGRDGGGAIFNSGGTVTLINCTIAGNTNVGGTQLGDGIFTEDDDRNDADPSNDRIAQTTLQNTLIAANDDDNCMPTGQQNPIADGGGNLDDGTSCAFSQTTSLSNATAGLAAGLQNNGGPTDTIALTTNPPSDAIDSGLNAFCSDAGTVNNLDQRGAPSLRPTDGDGDGNAFCDIGAFESDAASPQSNLPPVVTNPGDQTSAVGTIVNLPISASDPNGNTLSYSATGLPAGLSINAATGVVTGTLSTAGTSNVTVTVSDGQGSTASTGFIWTVTSAGTGPAPPCSGRTANIFVRDGFIVGGPDAGRRYGGRLRGTASADVMVGTPGNDIVVGSRGNDRICGGGGKDNIKGGAGKDRLFGERGKDKLSGGSGPDRCDGGPGRDTITACERILKR
jgi:CSLREA domain-containing protein